MGEGRIDNRVRRRVQHIHLVKACGGWGRTAENEQKQVRNMGRESKTLTNMGKIASPGMTETEKTIVAIQEEKV